MQQKSNKVSPVCDEKQSASSACRAHDVAPMNASSSEAPSFRQQLDARPWPKRAVVTAGMPYGNKSLHFGHIAGVFVPADCFSRFLCHRLGARNVLFVSGTDCFGSPINEGYRKACEQGFNGTLYDYVAKNHSTQKDALSRYGISLSIYEGSGIGRCGEIHQHITNEFITRLFEQGVLKRETTYQFYDTQAHTFLNGRQVVGRCPVQGCKSEHAYADECDMGHSYAVEELIAPHSTLSGTVPEMKPVENWYFDLPRYRSMLDNFVEENNANPQVRAVVAQTISEFLCDPVMYIKCSEREAFNALASQLPEHTLIEAENGKQSFELRFSTIEQRDTARDILHAHQIRFRTGKTLVPFRITGNIEWGVKAPVLDGVEGLTVWCWPESLWAPVSFTIAALEQRECGAAGAHGVACEQRESNIACEHDAAYKHNDDGENAATLTHAALTAQGDLAMHDEQAEHRSWRDYWCSDDARVYQFIGQDNLYFYGVAQPALFEALQGCDLETGNQLPAQKSLHQTTLIANHHVLLGGKKASSSGAVKPPSAAELLDYYPVETLRAHFLALALGEKSVGFKPQILLGSQEEKNNPRIADPVLKEGALLSNVFNRLARSVLYEAKNSYACLVPIHTPSPCVINEAHQALLRYDELMFKVELHTIMAHLDSYLRAANKRWATAMSTLAAKEQNSHERTAQEQASKESDTPTQVAYETSLQEQAVQQHATHVPSSQDYAGASVDTCQQLRLQTLNDALYQLWVSCLMMEPIAPFGCQKICDFLNFDPHSFFSWNHDFASVSELCSPADCPQGMHRVKELPARFDFFQREL